MFRAEEVIENISYKVSHESQKSFSAEIIMNPRDAMVVAIVSTLPDDPKEQEAIVAAFETYLKENVGGKILLQLPPSASKHPVTQEKTDVKFIHRENIEKALVAFQQRETVKKITETFENDNSSLLLLEEAFHYVGRYEALIEFKAKHGSDFVTSAKMAAGLYSATAEKEKISNPFVRHFAFYDNSTNTFIACLQLLMHGNKTYLSDLIVAQESRRQGYALALLIEAFKFMQTQKLDHAWIIEGKPDSKEIEEALHHLYDELLQAQPMTREMQEKWGLRLMFGGPKQLLLQASNRSQHPPHLTLDGKPTEVATLRSMGALRAPTEVRVEAAKPLMQQSQPTLMQ